MQILKSLFFSFLIFSTAVFADSPKTIVTIFIHGTSGSFIEMLHSPRILVKPYDVGAHPNRAQKAFRDLAFNSESQLMGPQGLMQLDNAQIRDHLTKPLSESDPCAWYHIVALYDTIARRVSDHKDQKRDYYLFGWSGRLSRSEREKAGDQFYEAVMKLRDEYRMRGEEPVFHFETHSHGGTVALHAARKAQKNGDARVVKRLCMYGTPMSREAVAGIKSPFYSEIYSISAPNDWIQKGDRFSTPDRKSSAHMQDVTCLAKIPDLIRRDIVVQCSSDEKSASLTHINLWQLDPGHYMARVIYPLPFVSIAPSAVALAQKAPYNPHRGPITVALHERCSHGMFTLRVVGTSHECDFGLELDCHAQHTQRRWKPAWLVTKSLPLNWCVVVARELRYAIFSR